MALQQEIVVRRAKVGDADKIAAFVNSIWQGRLEIDRVAVIKRLGSVGFLVVEQGGALVGMLGWQAENLVVRVTDFLVGAIPERVAIGQALLAEMEKAASELECEVALLFLPRSAPAALVEFYGALGYETQAVADLPKAWHEAALEGRLGDDDSVMVKRLRAQRVLRPL
jgi:N-acetylglutamate synthase-like GNAT family acetyltransferase